MRINFNINYHFFPGFFDYFFASSSILNLSYSSSAFILASFTTSIFYLYYSIVSSNYEFSTYIF